MTRVSLTEDYDDRSVISKLNEMDKRVKENASVVTAAEESARASAESAQETADRFAGSVGAVVQNANAQINASKAQVDSSKAEVDATVSTVAQAVQTANNASASAQASAQTVAGYGDRLQRAETDIQTLDDETEDLYRKDGENVKIGTPQYITGAKTFVVARTKNSLETKVDVPPQQRQTQPVQVIDRNDEQVMFNQLLTNTNGTRQYRTNLFSTNGTRVTVENIFLNADGTGYSTCVNPSAGAPSSAVVNKAYVEATDGTTNNLVHTIGDEYITGTKFFEGLTMANSIVQGHHNLVRVAGTGWRKIYTGTLEFNHHNIVLMVMPRRIGFGMGILSMGGQNGTKPVVNWMCGNIPTARRSDFVITYEESTQIATIWQQGTGATDGYCTCILAHSWNGNCYNNPWKSSTDNTLYNITESGYDEVVDGQTIHHTFKYYVRSE